MPRVNPVTSLERAKHEAVAEILGLRGAEGKGGSLSYSGRSQVPPEDGQHPASRQRPRGKPRSHVAGHIHNPAVVDVRLREREGANADLLGEFGPKACYPAARNHNSGL
jgi:hypothetical protein